MERGIAGGGVATSTGDTTPLINPSVHGCETLLAGLSLQNLFHDMHLELCTRSYVQSKLFFWQSLPSSKLIR